MVPLLDGVAYIDKPVLFHWLQGVAVALLGETEFAVRLPCALAAVGLFGITRWLGALLFDKETGEWGALMLATIPATFALSSVALFDMVFTAFVFGSVACLLVAAFRDRPQLQYTGYGLLILAIMTKGPVALLLVALFVAIMAAALPAARDRLSSLRWGRGLLIVTIGSAPWFLWMHHRFGGAFLEGYVLAGNLWYFTQPARFSRRTVSHVYYIRVFLAAFFPWSVIVFGRGLDMIRQWRARSAWPVEDLALWTWGLVVVGFFSLARFKLDHYIFPAAPACCLLAARGWLATTTRAGDVSAKATRFSLIAIAVCFVAAGIVIAIFLHRVDLGLPIGAFILPVACVTGGVVLWARLVVSPLRPPRSLTIVLVTLLVIYGTVVVIGFPAFEQTRPMARAGRWIAQKAAPGSRVAVYKLERWRASLRYYGNRRVERLESFDEVRAFLAQPGPAYLVMLRDDYETLQRANMPLRLAFERPAVVGTSGFGLRRQEWGYLVVAASSETPPHSQR
jgi:4-amino-4-deoxy-L-arabinose transferase-like glycosyltransferase